MSDQLIADFHKGLKKVPELQSGFTVRVHQKIKEGSKERVQIFEGLVIKVGSGTSVGKTFTVRKIMDGIGVEKTFPFHSTTVTKIQVVKKSKVRRAKLYYMRDRTGKSAKLYKLEGKAGEISESDSSGDMEGALPVEAPQEAVKAEEMAGASKEG